MALLTLQDAWKGYNDRQLLQGVSLTVREGERIGLLGRNGSGKSTLLRILAGLDSPEEGTRTLQRGLRLGYLEQDPNLDLASTARAIVRSGLTERGRILQDLEHVNGELSGADGEHLKALLARLGRLEEELERHGGHDVEHKIESTLSSLGIERFDSPCGELSGGERRRVALARLLLSGPELLLLDEPTNHLDAFVTQWLEGWFVESRTPLVLVTHDRYFLDRVVDRIVELDRGHLISYPGSYFEYLEARAARLETEGKTERSRLNLLRRESEWMRRGPPARTTKAKARIQRYKELAGGEPTPLSKDLELVIPPGSRLGSRVLKVEGIHKSYGERQVVQPLDLELVPAQRLGIVGPNGAGKTTLVRMLLGELEPDGGTREVGETVVFMDIDQGRRELDPEQTVAEVVAGRSDVVAVDGRSVPVRSFLDKFGFDALLRETPIQRLSGGEQNRVLLAKLLTAGGNVLVLDEPTNDLDLATLRALEEALLAFPGTLIVVSHDRWFLDRVATQILYLDCNGGARLHHGDLSGLLGTLAAEERARQAEAQSSQPRTNKKPTPAGTAPTRPRRLSPWEEKELAELEDRIAGLEACVARLDARLADPDLYQAPPEQAAAVRQDRARLDADLQEAYGRWEELESLRY